MYCIYMYDYIWDIDLLIQRLRHVHVSKPEADTSTAAPTLVVSLASSAYILVDGMTRRTMLGTFTLWFNVAMEKPMGKPMPGC